MELKCWGVEKVQMHVARISLGVRRLHPTASLQFEMDMLPLKWEDAKRATDIWVQVMRMNENRLMKVVMLEGLEMGSKVNFHHSSERCGSRRLDVMA